jgi:hypothetical protein
VSHKAADEQSKFIEGMRARQRNIVWPDTLINGRFVDRFFLKGSPNPTLVQRIAAWVVGVSFFLAGVLYLSVAKGERSLLCLVVSYGIILLGGLIFRNGFRRHQAWEDPKADSDPPKRNS